MPKATKVSGYERFDLKSAPPDGFVEIQRMSYGQVVERRAMMKLSFETGGKSKDFKGEMAMASVEVQRFEFSHCIGSHNLTDENDKPLNLALVADFTRLDPKVGQEIEKYIGELNNFDESDDGELGN